MFPRIVRLLLGTFPYRFAVAAAVGILAGACGSALIAAVAAGLDARSVTTMVVVGFAVAALSRVGTTLLSHVQLVGLTNDVLIELRLRLAGAVLATPLAALEELGNGRLVGALTEDIQLIGVAAQVLVSVLVALGTILGAVLYLVWISPVVAGMVVLLIAGGGLAFNAFERAGEDVMQSSGPLRGRMFGVLSATVSGVKELKLHRARRESFRAEAVGPALQRFHERVFQSFRIMAPGEAVNLILYFAVVGIIVFAWPRVSPSIIPSLSAIVLAVLYLATPISVLVFSRSDLMRADAILGDIEELGLSLSKSADRTEPMVAAPKWSTIELRGITRKFRNEDDRDFTLGPVSMLVRRAEIVFIVGGNGSGKTTLAKILLGLYDADEGEILLDGVPVATENRAAYRALFDVIFVEAQMFDRAFGVDPARADELGARLLARMKLDHKVTIKGGVFSTTALSHGQRKRVALVASLLSERDVYVFDEWAAEQDPAFKQVFYTEVLPELRREGRTAIVVSHDDRFFHVADRVIRLDEGRVRAASIRPPAVAPVAAEAS